MTTVTISINGQPVATRSATRLGLVRDNPTLYCYQLDDGTELRHRRKDGAIKLAIAMLKTIKEVGWKAK